MSTMRFTSRFMLGMALAIFAVAAFHAEGGVSFTATSANVSGAGETIRINITEWSSDSKRDEFVAAWTQTSTPAAGRGGRGGGAATGRGGAAAGAARGGGGAAGAGGATGRGAAGRGARGATAPDATTIVTANAAVNSAAPPLDIPPDPDNVDAANPNPAPRGGRGGGRGGAGAAAQTPESSLAAAIKKASTVGILWTSENVGYSIKYAYRLPQPGGAERIILATDRRVGMWSNLWQPATGVTATDYPFSIIELHLDSKGEGEGRGVLTGKVTIDSETRTIALDNYTALPVILKGLKRRTSN